MTSEKEVNDVNAVNKKKFTDFMSKHKSDLIVIILVIVGSIILYMVV